MINFYCIINWILLIAGTFVSYKIGKKVWPQIRFWIPPLVFAVLWLGLIFLVAWGLWASDLTETLVIFFIFPYFAQ